MHDTLYRHFLAILFTLVLMFMFWGGYVSGANGWVWTWGIAIPVYAFVFNRFTD